MKTKIKFTILGTQIVIIVLLQFLLSKNYIFVTLYDENIYYPLQSFRNYIIGFIPISIGDIIYILGGIAIFITLMRWIYFITKFGIYKEKLGGSLLNFFNATVFILLFFIVGWGGNYNKAPLAAYWHIQQKSSKKEELTALINFNKILVDRLNNKAPHYQNLSFKEINRLSVAWYKIYTDSRISSTGFGIKPTIFWYFIERLGIDGYYNPFTGEGQVNYYIPSFVLPFVICHEMAHQAGIAAEGDANLMAYAICNMTDDPTFNYSACINIWLYTNSKLYRRDSNLAKQIGSLLNPLTKLHLDTLEMLSKKFDNDMAKYSAEMYDNYLKLNNQKDGLKSYSNVAITAMLWEEKNWKAKKQLIKIP